MGATTLTTYSGVVVDSVEKARTVLEDTRVEILDIQFQLGAARDLADNQLKTEAWRRSARYALVQKEALAIRLRRYIRINTERDVTELLTGALGALALHKDDPRCVLYADRIRRHLVGR